MSFRSQLIIDLSSLNTKDAVLYCNEFLECANKIEYYWKIATLYKKIILYVKRASYLDDFFECEEIINKMKLNWNVPFKYHSDMYKEDDIDEEWFNIMINDEEYYKECKDCKWTNNRIELFANLLRFEVIKDANDIVTGIKITP